MDQKAPPFFAQLTDLAAVKATLLRQPAELHAARLAVADAERDLVTTRRRVKEIEGQIADERAEVDAMVASDPNLKNEGQRKAAARGLLKGNASIAVLEAQLSNAQNDVLRAEMAAKQAELEVKRLEDVQRAWRSHLDATQSEVMLLVHGR